MGLTSQKLTLPTGNAVGFDSAIAGRNPVQATVLGLFPRFYIIMGHSLEFVKTIRLAAVIKIPLIIRPT
jgi:hypothetical protein